MSPITSEQPLVKGRVENKHACHYFYCSAAPPIIIFFLKTCLNRAWRTDLPKGMCVLVAVSVEHDETPLMGDVRAVVLDSQYLIEPCGSGKSRLTHICRIDLK